MARQLNVSLPDELVEWLKQRSESTDIPQARIVRRALEHYLGQPRQKLHTDFDAQRTVDTLNGPEPPRQAAKRAKAIQDHIDTLRAEETSEEPAETPKPGGPIFSSPAQLAQARRKG